jgi:hypothetical protein
MARPMGRTAVSGYLASDGDEGNCREHVNAMSLQAFARGVLYSSRAWHRARNRASIAASRYRHSRHWSRPAVAGRELETVNYFEA